MATEINKTTDSQLLIDTIRQKYPDDTGQFFFKSCGEKWIVVLEETDKTITTQSRLPRRNPNKKFAKYRANELAVVDIICKFNPNKTTDQISNTFYKDYTIIYIKGSIVKPDSFDWNINKVCSTGIHFYETIDCAFYLELEKLENGKWTEWHENGEIKSKGKYLNGKRNGKWTEWHDNGEIKSEGEYLNGEKNGKWTQWHDNGQKHTEGEYVNGEKSGNLTSWYSNGQKREEGEYINGEQNGEWTEWHFTGEKEFRRRIYKWKKKWHMDFLVR